MGLFDDLGAILGGAGFPTSAGGSLTAPMQNGQPMSFVGSLLGDIQPKGQDYAGTIVGGLGHSLMTSPAGAPLKNFGAGIQAQAKANGLANNQFSLIQRLKAIGFTDEQATKIAQDPTTAQAVLGSSPLTGPTGEPVPSLSPSMPIKLGINS